ncbi:CHAT domain-containing protein [Actinopolyspora mortivallis]|uniref:CHAT domain-containing protein n=1 Tax=Actinopolyspora mortivallis TaxID=33906 RepID=A0A2T0GSK3_ACTMO|nr:CHAT domain-containing protein [Actinopolyspora mortivallis]PRW62023.1 CHAT domain-containing protein [Actinopolyspora mortivallis]
MDNQRHQRNQPFHENSRSPATPPERPADTGNSWFTTAEEPAEATKQLSRAGGEEQTPQQRYAEALTALNHMMATFDFQALSWVTEVLRATVSALPENDPSRPSVLNNLGSAAQLAHLASGDPAHLEDAITYYRSAANSAHPDDPDAVLYLSNLALARTDCANRKESAQLAADAVRAGRRAVERLGEADAANDPEGRGKHRATALLRLGNALKSHARLATDNESDDESIDVFRAARSASSADDPDLLTSLGLALLRRHERNAEPSDLDEGITSLGKGVGLLPEGQHRRSVLVRLAEALRLRYRQRGDLNDLQSAIDELFGMLDNLDQGNLLLGRLVWNLTSTTVEHLDSSGEQNNLYRALRSVSPMMRDLAADDPNRAVALASYGALARRHYLHGGNTAALDTAVAAGEAAVEAEAPPRQRCAVLNSLVSTLITRFERAEDRGDLDRAAELADEALRSSEARTAPQYTSYAQLGVIAAHRHRITGEAEELETAIEMFDRALIAMPDSAPERVAVATHLGRALQTLYRRTGRKKTYRWARRTLTEAATLPTGPADQRLRAANLCGRLAAHAHRWSEALDSFTLAVELLPLVTQGKRAVASSAVQRRWAHVTADAAACALEVGKPERAVELLEHGRAALFSELLPGGGELGRLNRTHPDLATAAVRLRRLLDRPGEEPVLSDTDLGTEVEERRWLATTWQELLEEIRAEDGHGRTMVPLEFARLAEANDQGAVVLVNLSRYRSDAIIVFGGRAMVVNLPAASPESAERHAETVLDAAQRSQRTAESEHALAETLDWVWHSITRPVLDRMGYTRTPAQGVRWPRLWWSCQGPCSFLPLHAATSAEGDSALDRVVSSYTPGLRTLLETASRGDSGGGGSLVVGPPDQQHAEHPARIPARHWPSATMLANGEHTAEDVVAALRRHASVHVCEPSTQNAARPAASLVLDREERELALNLLELGQYDFGNARFACLARCRTRETPSAAAFTLADAFAFLGFVHVIGTLWVINRGAAEDVLSAVYAELSQDGEFRYGWSPTVLSGVVRRLRRRYPDTPSLWAGYVHAGR